MTKPSENQPVEHNQKAATLYRMAHFLAFSHDYEIPRAELPEWSLTEDFAKGAQTVGAEKYVADIIADIRSNAEGNPALAAHMLAHLALLGEGKAGGTLVRQMAQTSLERVQMNFGLPKPQMG